MKIDRECPLCGSDRVRLVSWAILMGSEALYSVRCDDCGMESESHRDRKHAVRLWNDLPDEPETEQCIDDFYPAAKGEW